METSVAYVSCKTHSKRVDNYVHIGISVLQYIHVLQRHLRRNQDVFQNVLECFSAFQGVSEGFHGF